MKLAFTQKDLNAGKYLGTGRNTVRIKKAAIEKSMSGTSVLKVELVGVGDAAGREGFEFLSLSEKARFRIASLAKACGFTEEQLQSGEFETSQLVGKVFTLDKQETGTRMYNGQEKKTYKSEYLPCENTQNFTDQADDLADFDFDFAAV